MNTIEYNLAERLATFPFYINGKLDPKLLNAYIRNSFRTNENIKTFHEDSRNKNIGLRRSVCRATVEDLVINRVEMNITNMLENENLLQLNHKNIEKILYTDSTIDFFIWITPLFITKLKTVWVNLEQFRVYDVKKMFSDLLNGLEYMKAHNVASGVIHEDNLAYNGQDWYISGIVNSGKLGESASGQYITSSLKSPRYLREHYKQYIPEDDLWQLVLMYVITYYGFNPFHPSEDRFQNSTLLTGNRLNSEILENIDKGNCQEITLTTRADRFGQILKMLLLSKSLNCVSYELFRYIIENNGTTNTQGLDVLVDQESIASVERAQELENQNIYEVEFERERQHRNEIEKQKEDIVSVNIDQYIKKFKECECIICFSHTIKYRFLNCKHEICCNSCFQRLENKKCPMCREPIVETEELSLDYIKELNEKRKNIYFQIRSF
jgi:hypothetical protein